MMMGVCNKRLSLPNWSMHTSRIREILNIGPASSQRGFEIRFSDGRCIHLTKKRCIVALLVLIHKGQGTEADLAAGNTTISELRLMLGNKVPASYIQDFYGDANKPFSELWNEEGFVWIDNLKGGRRGRSQCYVLHEQDFDKLFQPVKKALRSAPAAQNQELLLRRQDGRCNLCGSQLLRKSEIKRDTYCKDRKRLVFDHRRPVERGGESELIANYQALCFYCNKSKWQICTICQFADCSPGCALAFPETSFLIAPTGEDISDRMRRRPLDSG